MNEESIKRNLRLKIEQKILERNKQDSGVSRLTYKLLNDIYDYMHVENNLAGLQELIDDLD